MKKIFALGLALTMALSLSACGQAPSESGGGAAEVTLCLDWTPNTNHTGFYAAQALGYYEEAGLSVTIVQPPEDGAAAVCAAGQAQFAIDAQDTIAAALALDEPLGVTAVAALIQHNTSGILSRAGEGMDTPAGMTGHIYATWDSPIEQAMLKKVVTDDGGDFSQVTMIPNNITDEAGALKEHQTDSVWVFYGWGGVSAELSGVETDYFAFADLDPVFDYYTPILIANNDFLASDPDTAKAFLAATAKGYQYAVEHPEEAAQMLIDGDETGSLEGSEELVKASQAWLSEQYISDAPYWGYIDPARWDGFYGWLWDNQLIEKELGAGTGFSNEYLPG